MLDFINEQVKPDVAFWGGDSVPHNLDSGSKEISIATMDIVTRAITTTLDSKLYMTIGSHDTFPQNSFSASKANTVLSEWAAKW